MVQNNKVLTVSYGTFSCTLEGFDDSFETMKAIAEYFRDLAADDRYFGSEPPQLDAEMLARIAQRDQSRRIEAHRHDDGVVLRATETAAEPAPTPEQPHHELRPGIAVASTHRTNHPNAMPEDEGDEPEDLSAPELAALTPEPADELPSTAALRHEPEFEEYEEEAAPQESLPPAADSIAAKLQRIRAVVSRADDGAGQYSEDEENGFPTDATAEPEDAISAAFATQPPAQPEPAADLTDEEEEPAAAAVEPIVDEPSVDEPIVDEPIVDEPSAEAPVSDAEAEEAPAPAASDLQTEAKPEGPQAISLAELATGLDHPAQAANDLSAGDDDLRPTDAESGSVDLAQAELEEEFDEPEAPLQQADDAVLSQEEESSDDRDAPEGTLTARDEADLLRKLAAVETALYARAEGQPDTDKKDDLTRLMDAADERMDDPSAGDSRQTYSHLRAAAAAAAAEKKAGSHELSQSSDKEYREDLASVVSPRRPEAGGTSRRPEPEGIAPLRLVAEQRIDTSDAETEKTPVHPRRVSSAIDADKAAREGGFARFAEEQGAHSLSDLLEAAAAYLSFVEGQEQFSRPQLMNKVRALQLEEFDREESLRSFGQLLRDGKIEKAGGGRFAASSEIGFRPDDERAAG
ncbi:hypothetical protein AVO45_01150 [Ruegeria marisrubri]|uniref:Chemotaxis protein CheA n=1 Tax=Ruegeria marisrubri TaxID=1685379 RepID=A0A101CYC2_9RHOB|nr:hypothetical protein [Ruegeria marisrubri]KUJ85628.1 hypothetical protein AVO45_01150 [Ruegeria marisrubri]